jgi:hypothetical protein
VVEVASVEGCIRTGMFHELIRFRQDLEGSVLESDTPDENVSFNHVTNVIR